MCCAACGDACKSCPGACQAICDPLRGCCLKMGNTIKHFNERPLSTYVLVSVVVSAAALYLSYVGLQTPKNCASNFLYIVMGFAVINVLFAWFLQNQVWKEIMSNKDKFLDGDAPKDTYKGKISDAATGIMGTVKQAAGTPSDAPAAKEETPSKQPGKIIIPSNVTQDAFKKVFMEDFVVLFMSIALIAMFVLSWKGQDKVDTAEVKCDVGNAEYCGYAFFCVGFLYSIAYYCCKCCAASVTIKKDTEDEAYDSLK